MDTTASPRRIGVRRADLAASAFLLIVGFLVFGDVLFGAKSFYVRDISRYYHPIKKAFRAYFEAGEFPYWGRLYSLGQPFAANPEHAVFYPPSWLSALPDYELGFRLQILLHIPLTLLAMYALLRSVGCRPPVAVFGALAWGCGGVFMSTINLLPIMYSAAWLPATLLFVRRFFLRRSIAAFAGAAGCFGIQGLVGEPTTLLQTAVLAGCYALYSGWCREAHGQRVRSVAVAVLWILAIGAVGFLAGAAQLVPAADLVRDSARSRPFPWRIVASWSMPWVRWLEVFFPYVTGHALRDSSLYWGRELYPRGAPFYYSIYSGMGVAILALTATIKRRPYAIFAIPIVIVSAVLAAGAHGPLLRLLYESGVVTAIRYFEKFSLMGCVALVCCGAVAMQRIVDGDRELQKAAVWCSLVIAAGASLAALAHSLPNVNELMSSVWQSDVRPQGAAQAAKDWSVAALLTATFGLLVRRVSLGGATAAAALAAFQLIDLVPIAREINPRITPAFYEPVSLLGSLPSEKSAFRVFHEPIWYRRTNAQGVFSPATLSLHQGYSSTRPQHWVQRNAIFPMVPAGHQVQTAFDPDYDMTELHTSSDLTAAMWEVKKKGSPNWFAPFAAMSNTWYQVSYRPYAVAAEESGGDIRRLLPVTLGALPRHPRYFFAEEIVTINGSDDFVAKVASGRYPLRAAYVAEAGSFRAGKGNVTVVAETPNSATMDIAADAAGFLVLSVTAHRYWRVEVDGRLTPWVTTNLGLMGLPVAAGSHRVVMRYVNPLILPSAVVSMTTFILCGMAAFFAGRRRSA